MTTRWKFPYRFHFPTSVQREQDHAQVAAAPPPSQAASLLLNGPPAAAELPPPPPPPPPPSLVTTNRAPSDSEAAHCGDAAEEAILQARAVVNDLEKQEAKQLEFIDAHRVAVSPLRSFPPELLEEVFAQYVTMAGPHWHPSVPPPLILTRICSRWRQIVLDTPRLWTKIFQIAYPMIDYWIIRSKDLPLHVELDLTELDLTAGFDSYLASLDALIPLSHRWEYVNFRFEKIPPSLDHVRNRLPSLRRLDLSFDATDRTIDLFKVAPQLIEVKLTGPCTPSAIKLPWEQLRVCTLEGSRLAYHVLQYAKNLQTYHLDMSNLFPSRSFTPNSSHLYYQGLDTLIIEWNLNDPGMCAFFSSVTISSLRTLEVRFGSTGHGLGRRDDGDQLRLGPAMSGFFKRSCAHLNALKFTDIPFSPDRLAVCLGLSPSLVSLDIHFNGRYHTIDNGLLRKLDVSYPRYTLPRLRSLSFRGRSTFSLGLLDGLITSRRHITPVNAGVTLLENLIMACSIPQKQSTKRLPQFHRFVPEGLNIVYREDWNIYNSML